MRNGGEVRNKRGKKRDGEETKGEDEVIDCNGLKGETRQEAEAHTSDLEIENVIWLGWHRRLGPPSRMRSIVAPREDGWRNLF